MFLKTSIICNNIKYFLELRTFSRKKKSITYTNDNNTLTDEEELELLLINDQTNEIWLENYDKKDIEIITKRTGSFINFQIFFHLLKSAIQQTSHTSTISIWTFNQLNQIRNLNIIYNKNKNIDNNKRYVVVTYKDEYNNIIHYPLILSYKSIVHNEFVKNNKIVTDMIINNCLTEECSSCYINKQKIEVLKKEILILEKTITILKKNNNDKDYSTLNIKNKKKEKKKIEIFKQFSDDRLETLRNHVNDLKNENKNLINKLEKMRISERELKVNLEKLNSEIFHLRKLRTIHRSLSEEWKRISLNSSSDLINLPTNCSKISKPLDIRRPISASSNPQARNKYLCPSLSSHYSAPLHFSHFRSRFLYDNYIKNYQNDYNKNEFVFHSNNNKKIQSIVIKKKSNKSIKETSTVSSLSSPIFPSSPLVLNKSHEKNIINRLTRPTSSSSLKSILIDKKNKNNFQYSKNNKNYIALKESPIKYGSKNSKKTYYSTNKNKNINEFNIEIRDNENENENENDVISNIDCRISKLKNFLKDL